MNSSKSLKQYREELLKKYKGKDVNSLPTPSFVVDLDVVSANTAKMVNGLSMVSNKLRFRPHVKTHKTAEIAAIQVTSDGAVVASTLSEIRGLIELVDTGVVKDVLYGIPPTKSKIADLAVLVKTMIAKGGVLRLMIDNVEQLYWLRDFANHSADEFPIWSVFFKVNVGDNRAGQVADSEQLTEMIYEAVELVNDQYVELYGFYAHAGGSYSSTDVATAMAYLTREIEGVHAAAEVARNMMHKTDLDANTNHRFVISVGATPTAHTSARGGLPAVSALLGAALDDDDVEVHAGNYAILDMQQVATGLVSPADVAGYVVAEVIGYYPERDEYLIDAGVLALAREPGRIPGIATIKHQAVSGDRYIVGRVSQEHGILCRRTDVIEDVIEEVGKGESTLKWKAGGKVLLLPQHACITSSMYQWYFAVQNGLISDVLLPWRGW
ncbi:putative serine dehydratase domain-containing protein [Lipomyces arxii]|uniref:putative serine dehydratase domain-containing protein n=1 Tax=Lipomyces arxii TaxID=56418 RepID=UPI0034CFBD86